MTWRERLILGMGHCIGSGALAFGVWAARGHLVPALIFGGGAVGMLMLGMIWMSGDLD